MKIHGPPNRPLYKYGTNFPSVLQIKGALSPEQGKPKKKGKKSRRRTASQLMAQAGRDAKAWQRRTMAKRQASSGQSSGHRQKAAAFSYRVATLTANEYATLAWLADRGYDAEILRIAGVEEEHPNGDVTLGTIPEHKAWIIQENIERDPHAFLTSCGSKGLAEKLNRFVNSIV